MCKTKDKQSSGRGAGGPRKADVGKRGGAAHHVRQVEAEVLRRKFQRRSQILSPTRRETMVVFCHMSPRIWGITNKQCGGGADKCEICLHKAYTAETANGVCFIYTTRSPRSKNEQWRASAL